MQTQRRANTSWQIEGLPGDVQDARQFGGPSRDHDARRQQSIISRFLDLLVYHAEQLLHAGLDNLREQFARYEVVAIGHELREIDHIVLVDERWIAVPIRDLEFFGNAKGQAQADSNVVGDMVAADGQDDGMPDRAVAKD